MQATLSDYMAAWQRIDPSATFRIGSEDGNAVIEVLDGFGGVWTSHSIPAGYVFVTDDMGEQTVSVRPADL